MSAGAGFDAGRVVAVMNAGSGGWTPASPGEMTDILKAAGLGDARVVSAQPDEIDGALAEAVTGADLVITLGGDGTVRSAAALCGKAGKRLAPLPGGTMNMLPHALYGQRSWQAALADTLASPRVRTVSGGRANGQPFYCAAILGAPSLWADAREALRQGDLAEAAEASVAALRHVGGDPLDYRLGEVAAGEAEAVAVICPLISKALDADTPALEAAALGASTAADLFRLAFHAVFDDWRRDPSVALARVQRLSVRAKGRVPVILDGERARLGAEVRVTFTPRAFEALAPAGTPGGASG